MNRFGHYTKAEELVEQAVQRIAQSVDEKFPAMRHAARDDAHLYLRAALIHATLATAGPGVEPEAVDPQVAMTPPPPPPYEPTGIFSPKPGPHLARGRS